MTVYYNEHDPYASQWLRNLIAAGHLPAGDVDERSIEDVRPAELMGYTQCHFFAGIGGWSLALRLAGWPDDRPVWTGSCPCQPFSAAGKGKGHADERHLWPAWFHLIEQCQPGVIFGEQVEAAIRHGWLDLVQADLEGIGYAFGAVGLPAAGVGAPHIRQRLWFVGESLVNTRQLRKGRDQTEAEPISTRGVFTEASASGELADTQRRPAERRGHDVHATSCSLEGEARERQRVRAELGTSSDARELADPDEQQRDGRGDAGARGRTQLADECGLGELVHPGIERLEGQPGHGADIDESRRLDQDSSGSSPETGTAGFWSAADWLPCRDGKARPVEPGTFPLAHGVSARVGRLRGYGNAIVPQVAAEVIRSYLEIRA